MADDFFSDIGAGIDQTFSSLGETLESVGSGIGDLGNGITSFLQSVIGADPNTLASSFRAAGIPAGAEPNINYVPVSAQFSTSPEQKDWRVKLYHPMVGVSAPLLPLAETMGMIFPYLPTITMSHSANYQQIDITHTNYPFYAYKNSQVDEITINGKFTVQNQHDGIYWLACVHFLRTVTKMYFGQGDNLGNPPPICTLNGYGDFVYNNVSVVVKNFTVTLPNEVDYIAINLSTTPGTQTGTNLSYVPALSDISVTLLPVYSRDKMKSFNLEAFANGQLIVGNDGRGFI